MENNKDMSQVLHGLGKLTGAVETMHQGMTLRMDEIRQDMRRMEQAQSDRMNRMEEHVSDQLDAVRREFKEGMASMSTRVEKLEEEDKRTITQLAKISAGGGGIGGALVVAAVEIFKRMP
nr:hypothetical protein [uncultured Comamonas sp.]